MAGVGSRRNWVNYIIHSFFLIAVSSFHFVENLSQDGFVRSKSEKSLKARVEENPVEVPDIFPVKSPAHQTTENLVREAFHKRAINIGKTFTDTLVYPTQDYDEKGSGTYKNDKKHLDVSGTNAFQKEVVDLGENSKHRYMYPEIPPDDASNLDPSLQKGNEKSTRNPSSAQIVLDTAVSDNTFHKRAVNLQDLTTTLVYPEPFQNENTGGNEQTEMKNGDRDLDKNFGAFHKKAVNLGDPDKTYVFPQQSLEDDFTYHPIGNSDSFLNKPVKVSEVTLLKQDPDAPLPVLEYKVPRKRRPRRGGVHESGHFLDKEINVDLPFVTDRFHNPVTGSFIRPHMYGSNKWKALMLALGSHDNTTEPSLKDSFYSLLAEVVASLRSNVEYGTPLKTEIQNILALKRELLAQETVQEHPADYLTAEWNETLQGFREGHQHTMKMLSGFVDAHEDEREAEEPILVLEGDDLDELSGFREGDDDKFSKEVPQLQKEKILPTTAIHVYNFGKVKEIKQDNGSKNDMSSSKRKLMKSESEDGQEPGDQLKVMKLIDELANM